MIDLSQKKVGPSDMKPIICKNCGGMYDDCGYIPEEFRTIETKE